MDREYPFFTFIAPTANVSHALEQLSVKAGSNIELLHPLRGRRTVSATRARLGAKYSRRTPASRGFRANLAPPIWSRQRLGRRGKPPGCAARSMQ
jgi:hypothetical protein